MKPIIINMNEMSDSREVYESRPNRALPLFLYVCLGLFAAAVVWMCFGKIDITVKATGMLRPDEAVNTVVNTVGGEVILCHAEDGKAVEAGELLYVVSHEDLLAQKEFYEGQKEFYEEQYEGLRTYLKSIQEEKSYFPDMSVEYAVRYQGFQLQLDAMRLEMKTDAGARAYSKGYLEEQLAYYKEELAQTKILLESVQSGESRFPSKEDTPYYMKYQRYQSDYQALEQQYADKQRELERSTGEESLINSAKYYSGIKEGIEALIASIEMGKNCFEDGDTGIYANQFLSYETKQAELFQNYKRAEEAYEINKELEGIAVSAWETEESRLAKEQAWNTYESYKTTTLSELKGQLAEAEIKLNEVILNQTAMVDKETLLKENAQARENALRQYYLGYIVELQNSRTALEENLKTLERQLSELSYASDKVLVYGDGEEKEYAAVRKYKNDEIAATQQSLASCEASLQEMNAKLDSICRSIEDCYVKSPCSGIMNMIQELVVGNTIAAGSEVLSVLPMEETGYKCVIYVENADVGGLQTGMPVKFNVYSYPNAEYGYVYGTLTKVSKDIRVDSQNGMAYYQAEASVDVGNFLDSAGRPIALKAGMACEAKIITGEKRILNFVLEKLNLLASD